MAAKKPTLDERLAQCDPDAPYSGEVWPDVTPIGREFGAPSPRDPWKPRYFLDTEFTSFETCQLISVAIVGEDGNEFYGEVTDFEPPLCSDFVRAVVLPQLGQMPGRSMSIAQLRSELLAWLHRVPLKLKPVLCFDYLGDLQLVEHLIGGPLPKSWKTENVNSRLDASRLAAYFAEHGHEHHALHDARANCRAFN